MKLITVQVEFMAQVPDNTSPDDIEVITCDINPDLIKLHGQAGEIKGAKVTGYATTAVFNS